MELLRVFSENIREKYTIKAEIVSYDNQKGLHGIGSVCMVKSTDLESADLKYLESKLTLHSAKANTLLGELDPELLGITLDPIEMELVRLELLNWRTEDHKDDNEQNAFEEDTNYWENYITVRKSDENDELPF